MSGFDQLETPRSAREVPIPKDQVSDIICGMQSDVLNIPRPKDASADSGQLFWVSVVRKLKRDKIRLGSLSEASDGSNEKSQKRGYFQWAPQIAKGFTDTQRARQAH